jgi:hypothetical protein
MGVINKTWAKAAGIRALKTVAQTAVAMIPAAVTIGAVDWKTVVGTAVLAGVVSVLTSIAGLPEVREENEDG